MRGFRRMDETDERELAIGHCVPECEQAASLLLIQSPSMPMHSTSGSSLLLIQPFRCRCTQRLHVFRRKRRIFHKHICLFDGLEKRLSPWQSDPASKSTSLPDNVDELKAMRKSFPGYSMFSSSHCTQYIEKTAVDTVGERAHCSLRHGHVGDPLHDCTRDQEGTLVLGTLTRESWKPSLCKTPHGQTHIRFYEVRLSGVLFVSGAALLCDSLVSLLLHPDSAVFPIYITLPVSATARRAMSMGRFQ